MSYQLSKKRVFAYIMAAALFCGAPAHAAVIGVNGHDVWSPAYSDPSKTEAVFQLLNSKNLRSYRVDVSNNAQSIAVLKRLVTLGKKYNIAIRPMLYVDSGSSNDAYVMAKTFANDITLWELGNELNLRGVSQFTNSINLMIQARAGVMKAAAETGKPLKTGINTTNDAAGLVGINLAHTSYPFIDKAISMGLQFDFITFHMYPQPSDTLNNWAPDYFNAFKKYGKPVYVNETNCAQIYTGDDGNSQACADNMDLFLAFVTKNYASLVPEITLYELFDETNKAANDPEAHFGLMFNINQPKKTLAVASKYGSAGPVTPPTTPPTTPPPANSSNATFVTQVYTSFLDKAPSAGVLNNYVTALNNGSLTRKNLVISLAKGAEFKTAASGMTYASFVTHLYAGILGRAPDTAGFNSWVSSLKSTSVTKSQAIQAFISSAEFQARKF